MQQLVLMSNGTQGYTLTAIRSDGQVFEFETVPEELEEAVKLQEDYVAALMTESEVRAAKATAFVVANTSVEEQLEMMDVFPPWEKVTTLEAGMRVTHAGILYEVVQSHKRQYDWRPDLTPALFNRLSPADQAGKPQERIQPTGAHDAYNKGDRVIYGGLLYESLVDGNVWSPAAHPPGWQKIESEE